MISCRLIVDPPQPGAWNMAVDEALLESAVAGGSPVFRLYRWSEPTLSLGYFQPVADRQAHRASLGCPLVRRRSGGGAILHHHELTYALIVPPERESHTPQQHYDLVHDAIVEILTPFAAGAGLMVRKSAGIKRSPAAEPFLCFERRAVGDVVLADHDAGTDVKVAGSAQRKHRGAILQHGSILITRSTAAPELPGLCDLCRGDLCGAPAEPAKFAGELADLLTRAVQLRGDFSWKPDKLTSLERERAEMILAERFAQSDWNHNR
jgi:lipoyl(octanoyl) transferase